MDSVLLGDCLDRLYSFASDESASLGEWFEPPLQSEDHPFQKASVEHVRKWMAIKNAVNIGLKRHAGDYLPQSSEEHSRSAGSRREILRIPGIAHDGVRSDAIQEE